MNYNILAFTSGGAKGLAFIGSLIKLKELDLLKNFNSFIGTSIGAMLALICALDIDPTIIKNYLLDKNMTNMYDIRFLTFFNNYGFESTKYIMKMFEDVLQMKHICKNITLIQLFNITNRHLVIVASNLHNYEPVYFDHINYPNVKVLFAIRCSINIPILFHAIKFENFYLADGALSDDVPVNPLNKDKSPIFNNQNNIVCLRLATKPLMNIPITFNIDNFESYIYHSIYCSINSYSKTIYLLLKEKYKIINIDTKDFSCTDFNIDNNTKLALFELGYNTISSNLLNS